MATLDDITPKYTTGTQNRGRPMDKREVPVSDVTYPEAERLLLSAMVESVNGDARMVQHWTALYRAARDTYADSRVQAALAPLRKELENVIKEWERTREVVEQQRAALRDMERQRDENRQNWKDAAEQCELFEKEAAAWQQSAETAEQALAQQRWIPVEERLPEAEGRYLVSYRHASLPPRVFIGDFDPRMGWNAISEGTRILAWRNCPEPMPLPSPPPGQKEQGS